MCEGDGARTPWRDREAVNPWGAPPWGAHGLLRERERDTLKQSTVLIQDGGRKRQESPGCHERSQWAWCVGQAPKGRQSTWADAEGCEERVREWRQRDHMSRGQERRGCWGQACGSFDVSGREGEGKSNGGWQRKHRQLLEGPIGAKGTGHYSEAVENHRRVLCRGMTSKSYILEFQLQERVQQQSIAQPTSLQKKNLWRLRPR